MADPNDDSIVRVSTRAFRHMEHFVYIALGLMLSAAVILALGSVAVQLFQGFLT